MLFLILCLPLQDAPPVKTQIQRLGSEDAEVREAAALDLKKRGRAAVLPLEGAARGPNAEIAARVKVLLASIPARDRYEAHLEVLKKDDAASQVQIGEYALDLDLYEEGVDHLDRAAELDPRLRKTTEARVASSGEGMVRAALKAMKDGDKKKGLRLCRLAVNRCPEGKAVRRANHIIEGGGNPEDLAMRAYQEGYKLLIKGRDKKGAIECFEKALSFDYTEYMSEKLPPSGKTRIEIVEGLLRAAKR